jgi:hypothetical protein
MRLPILFALGAGAWLLSSVPADAGVVYRDTTRAVSVFPEATQDGVNPPQGPRREQAGTDVFFEIVNESFTGPDDGTGFGTARQVSTFSDSHIDFHGQVTAETGDPDLQRAGPFIVARSSLVTLFDVTTPTAYALTVDYDAQPDLDSQNPDNALDVLELTFRREEAGGDSTLIYAEDRTFFELFPKNVPGSTGVLQPGRYRLAVNFDAPVRGIQDVDLTYDIDMAFEEANPIPLPPAAWAGLLTLVPAAVAAMGVRRTRGGDAGR